jgi:hypothetical protein
MTQTPHDTQTELARLDAAIAEAGARMNHPRLMTRKLNARREVYRALVAERDALLAAQ